MAVESSPPSDLITDLVDRGLVQVSTDLDGLRELMAAGPISLYYGCDPTADSLHVGNLIGLTMLRRFQQAGHRVVALAGGATGMVGDPSGRSDERNLLDDETLSRNVAAIKAQISRVVELAGDDGVLVDNREWTEPLTLLEFLRDVGRFATINQMVARESVRNRLESEHGISYTEFSYMLLQANDYLWLHDHHGCVLQIGGSDQWGNIVSGVDLIRRARGAAAHALSWPLLLAADGTKLGKTTGARTWLDPERTSPYAFHQHFVNLADAEVSQQLPMFSMRPLNELRELLTEHAAAPERRLAQRALADELTALVHGPEAAEAAAAAGAVLFGGDPTAAPLAAFEAIAREVPTAVVDADALADPVALLVELGAAGSKSEARRLIDQGGVRVNGTTLATTVTLGDVAPLHGAYYLVRRGKHQYFLVRVHAG